jgi:integrase
MAKAKLDPRFRTYRRREWVAIPGQKSRVRLIATGDTVRECNAAFERKRLQAIAAADTKRQTLPVATGTRTFEAFSEAWLRDYPAAVGNRENTLIEKAYHLRIHVLPFFKRLAEERGGEAYTLAEVTPRVLDRFAAELAKTPRISRAKTPTGEAVPTLAPKSVANIVQTVRKMLTTAKRWGEIDIVPEISKVKVAKPAFDFFDFADADRLLAAIKDPDDRALITTAMRSGARAGELLGLQWSNIDLVKREIRIDRQLARKGSALVPVKAGERSVPMPAGLVATLKDAKHLRGAFVFSDQDGRPFSRGHLRKTLAKWCRRAGLREMHPHGLRHTFASHLVMRGVPLIQVQQWLGHSSITMTMRYAHLGPGAGSSLIDRLEERAPAEPAAAAV